MRVPERGRTVAAVVLPGARWSPSELRLRVEGAPLATATSTWFVQSDHLLSVVTKRVARVSDVANSDHGVRGTGHPEASVQRLLAGGSGRRTRRARAHSAATIWPGDRHAAGTREYAKWPNGQVANFVAAWHEPRRHRCDARAGVRDPARIART